MCGIVGASAERHVEPILLEGLRRLEYRGYDSAGMALVDQGHMSRTRAVGKVQALADKLEAEPRPGSLGIAHTRWATHGGVSENNAHPHVSTERVAVVHNGIIENFETLRERLIGQGYAFDSETDTEVVAHLVESHLAAGHDLTTAVRRAVAELDGAYALAVICRDDPETLVAARSGSPLVLGVGIGEHFVASDVAALLPVTRRFIYLEEGDLVTLTREHFAIIDHDGQPVDRAVKESELSISATEKGGYRHFMLKEIHEQPRALADTWQGRLSRADILASSLGHGAEAMLDQVESIHIVACGTSHHAGLVARYWLEAAARIPCNVELASEYRYRDPVVPKNCLFITLSQSGETADTLAALRYAKTRDNGQAYLATLAICNKPESSLTPRVGSGDDDPRRARDRRGLDQGVHHPAHVPAAAHRHALARAGDAARPGRRYPRHRRRRDRRCSTWIARSGAWPRNSSTNSTRCFWAAGPMYPIAMEGALKLKEISYLHAEAYAAGELKHGPLALVDEEMPVVAIAPKNDWLEKVKSNLQEVRARGGNLYVFADGASGLESAPGLTVLDMPHVAESLSPIVYTVPLQLLAYHVAVAKGTDVGPAAQPGQVGDGGITRTAVCHRLGVLGLPPGRDQVTGCVVSAVCVSGACSSSRPASGSWKVSRSILLSLLATIQLTTPSISPLARLPTISRLIPTRIAKKMIDSISPWAMALIGFDGTMLVSTSDSGGVSAPLKSAADLMFMPEPIPLSTAPPIATAIAMAVVII